MHAAGKSPPTPKEMRRIIDKSHESLLEKLFKLTGEQLGLPEKDVSLSTNIGAFKDTSPLKNKPSSQPDGLDYIELMSAFRSEFHLPFARPDKTGNWLNIRFETLGDVYQYILDNRHTLNACIKKSKLIEEGVCLATAG